MHFRRLLVWQLAALVVALAHVPHACASIAAVLPSSSPVSLQHPVLALAVLQGLLVPALLSYMLERLARMLFLLQLGNSAHGRWRCMGGSCPLW